MSTFFYVDTYPRSLRLTAPDGLGITLTHKLLSIPMSHLDNWVRAAKFGKLTSGGKGQRLPNELKLASARKELVKVQMERGLQRKLITHFAKESQ